MGDRPNDESSVVGSCVCPSWFDVYVDRHRVANVSGELDVSTAPHLAVELDRLVEDGGIVCVDFSNLTCCGAAGINVLVCAAHTMGDRGRLIIYDPSPMVTRLIDITGLDSLVEVVAGRDITAPHPSSTNDTDRGSAHRTVTAGSLP